jgi:predicted Ser/Thr protein kinase
MFFRISICAELSFVGVYSTIEKDAIASAIISGNGNRVVIHQYQIERQVTEDPSARVGEIGPNPYKGLLAFQETDGDRFFGREKQIEQLWNQFRSLHEDDSVIRLLPIYGPSGSGKSSLARAGLIPELARRPLPEYAVVSQRKSLLCE